MRTREQPLSAETSGGVCDLLLVCRVGQFQCDYCLCSREKHSSRFKLLLRNFMLPVAGRLERLDSNSAGEPNAAAHLGVRLGATHQGGCLRNHRSVMQWSSSTLASFILPQAIQSPDGN